MIMTKALELPDKNLENLLNNLTLLNQEIEHFNEDGFLGNNDLTKYQNKVEDVLQNWQYLAEETVISFSEIEGNVVTEFNNLQSLANDSLNLWSQQFLQLEDKYQDSINQLVQKIIEIEEKNHFSTEIFETFQENIEQAQNTYSEQEIIAVGYFQELSSSIERHQQDIYDNSANILANLEQLGINLADDITNMFVDACNDFLEKLETEAFELIQSKFDEFKSELLNFEDNFKQECESFVTDLTKRSEEIIGNVQKHIEETLIKEIEGMIWDIAIDLTGKLLEQVMEEKVLFMLGNQINQLLAAPMPPPALMAWVVAAKACTGLMVGILDGVG